MSGTSTTPSPEQVVQILLRIGTAARDSILHSADVGDVSSVVREEGGDRIFGVDRIAEEVLLPGLEVAAREERFTIEVVTEGADRPLTMGGQPKAGQPLWRVILDPLDGSRPWLAGKRSGWVLLGAGRNAQFLHQLEVAVCVEVPARFANRGRGLVAVATAGSRTRLAEQEFRSGKLVPFEARPSESAHFRDAFVSVARFAPGNREVLGRFEDRVLSGLGCLDDAQASSMGQLIGVTLGHELAVIDARPYFPGGEIVAHPYDLAGWLILKQAGE